MQKLIASIDRGLAAVENFLIVAILTVMVVLAFVQVILRNMDAGLLWADIFLRHLVLWVGFVGASLATRDGKHIRIDAVNRFVREAWLPYIKIVVDAATIAVCIWLTHAAITFVGYEYEFETILFGETPAWIFQLIIPIGFAMIAFRFFLRLLSSIFSLFDNRPPAEDPS